MNLQTKYQLCNFIVQKKKKNNEIDHLPCFKSSLDFEFGCKVLTVGSNLSDYLKTSGGFKQLFCGYTVTLWEHQRNMGQRSPSGRS